MKYLGVCLIKVVQDLHAFCIEIDKLIKKFMWNAINPRIAKTILKKINKTDFHTYYKMVTIQTMLYWEKKDKKDNWNRINGLKIDPQVYGQFIID